MARNSRLYQVLGVEKGASKEEIKKAYHKAAVRFHPDRNGPEASEAKFQEIQGAYEVLSDDKMKVLYDKYGEQGLKIAQQGGDNAMMFATFDPALIFCMMLTISVPFILFLVFLTLRVDDKVSWSWGTTFIPLWIMEAVAMCLQFMTLASALTQKQEDPDMPARGWRFKASIIAEFVKVACFVVWTILLSLRLDDHYSWEFKIVFIPVYILIVVDTLQTLYNLTFKQYTYLCNAVGLEVTRGGYIKHVVWGIVGLIRFPVFIMLLVLKLDNHMSKSWWHVALPYLIVAGLALAKVIIDGVNTVRNEGNWAELIAFLIVWGFVFSPFIMVIAKANGAGISLAVCFIPIWILIACAFCFGCCIACMFQADPEDDTSESVPIRRSEHENTKEADPSSPASVAIDVSEEKDTEDKEPSPPAGANSAEPVPPSNVEDID